MKAVYVSYKNDVRSLSMEPASCLAGSQEVKESLSALSLKEGDLVKTSHGIYKLNLDGLGRADEDINRTFEGKHFKVSVINSYHAIQTKIEILTPDLSLDTQNRVSSIRYSMNLGSQGYQEECMMVKGVGRQEATRVVDIVCQKELADLAEARIELPILIAEAKAWKNQF